ncbi:hydrolase [bacterium]|nr:hydrolase [bacterium]
MLDIQNSVFVIIDIQEKLVNAVGKYSPVVPACKLVKAASILGIPVIVTEQYPKGLGETVLELKEVLNASPIEKTSFSACLTPEFLDALTSTGRKQVVICGIEAHICVYQTICDLLEQGYEVYFVKDASASRKKCEFETGVELIKQVGAKVTCTEIVLFELLKTAGHPDFKQVQALIK